MCFSEAACRQFSVQRDVMSASSQIADWLTKLWIDSRRSWLTGGLHPKISFLLVNKCSQVRSLTLSDHGRRRICLWNMKGRQHVFDIPWTLTPGCRWGTLSDCQGANSSSTIGLESRQTGVLHDESETPPCQRTACSRIAWIHHSHSLGRSSMQQHVHYITNQHIYKETSTQAHSKPSKQHSPTPLCLPLFFLKVLFLIIFSINMADIQPVPPMVVTEFVGWAMELRMLV